MAVVVLIFVYVFVALMLLLLLYFFLATAHVWPELDSVRFLPLPLSWFRLRFLLLLPAAYLHADAMVPITTVSAKSSCPTAPQSHPTMI